MVGPGPWDIRMGHIAVLQILAGDPRQANSMWYIQDVPIGFELWIHRPEILQTAVLETMDVEYDGLRLNQLFANENSDQQWAIQMRLGIPLQVVRFHYLCLVSGQNPVAIRFKSKIGVSL